MFDVCPACGEFRADKSVNQTDSTLVCPECGHAEPFNQLPLLVISGAAGTGKSTVLRGLRGTVDRAVLLDSDMLWDDKFRDDASEFFEIWLRLCRDIAQSGQPPVLFGAGFGVPDRLRRCPQYECFSDIHYLILVCDDDVQRQRLQARPSWRKSSGSELTDHIEYNRWLKSNTEEGISRVDTTDSTITTTRQQVRDWLESILLH